VGTRFVALAALAVAVVGVSADDRSAALSFASRAAQPGELVVATIAGPNRTVANTPVTVKAFGHSIPAFPTGEREWQALIGIDLDVKPGTYPVSAAIGDITTARNLVVGSKIFRTRRLTVDPGFVTPPETEAARIADEAKLLERTYAASAPQRLWTPFAVPVPQPTNSAFGTRSIFNGEPRSPHAGTDFRSPAGTRIKAPNTGRVVIARELFFSGNTVVIDHGLGLFSLLAHLSRIDVHEGDQVERGALVGLVGATGRVTGAHLHWAVRADDARVSALSLLALAGESPAGP